MTALIAVPSQVCRYARELWWSEKQNTLGTPEQLEERCEGHLPSVPGVPLLPPSAVDTKPTNHLPMPQATGRGLFRIESSFESTKYQSAPPAVP
eukprot:844135-Prorocentrum_minimum.AAC.3